MINMFIRIVLCMGLAAVASMAWSAVERETFEVFVTIPTQDFYVLPVDPQLVLRTQQLPYNPVTSQLSPLRAQYDVKNIAGSVGARLAQEAFLSNGIERIDLRVTFNEVELSQDRSEILDVTQARPGRRVSLEIAAIKPADDYAPGDYYGTVHMVFDAIAP